LGVIKTFDWCRQYTWDTLKASKSTVPVDSLLLFGEKIPPANGRNKTMASILLFGLENDLAESLALILRQMHHMVRITDSLTSALSHPGTQVLFAGGDRDDYRDTIRLLVVKRPATAVVMVNRLPENGRWLDALELGAADYCGAPFEPVQIRWLLEGVMRDLEIRAQAA
jgi:DNA-binding response OmpR family regulator